MIGSSGGFDWPLRREGCLVFRIETGRAVVSARDSRIVVRGGSMAILFPETSFAVLRISAGFSASFLWLSERIMQNTYNRLTNLSFWDFIYQYPVFRLTPGQQALLARWWDTTVWTVSESAEPYRDSLLSNQMTTLFMGIDSELIRNDISGFRPESARTFSLVGRFFFLLSTDVGSHHDVSHYAGRLCITPDYLNKITHRYYGISAKEMIDQFLISEIKNSLSFSNATVKEIAAQLGFPDSSYMCRFFRRHTSLSPLDYRRCPND